MKRISVFEAQINDEYWRLVETMFREQAARVIQSHFRTKQHTQYSGKYTETLHDVTHRIRFLQEPYGVKARAHAKVINAGDWEGIDFKDPEFVRNIYKALRLRFINKNQMVTALFLHGAQQVFQNKIKKHAFDKPGPYQIKPIDYISKKNITNFLHRLKELDPKERCYFSVNLSKITEVLFIYDKLQTHDAYSRSFINLLKAYLQKLPLPKNSKTYYLGLADSLLVANDTALINSKRLLLQLIKRYEANLADILNYERKGYTTTYYTASTLDHMITGLITNLLNQETHIPFIEISPDYDAKNPNTPTLCMIIPTGTVMHLLQETMHGDDRVVPYFTAGQVTTRLIRALDENPRKYGQYMQSRPIELEHPDLIAAQNTHGFRSVSPFLRAWHDMVHCWVAGLYSEPAKKLNRYHRELLSKEKKVSMSKSIWQLADNDFSNPWMVKSSLKEGNKEAALLWSIQLAADLIAAAGIDFWTSFDTYDVNLLIIIDMIRNRQQWKYFLFDSYPEDNFKLEGPDTIRGMKISDVPNFFFTKYDLAKFQTIFHELKKIIDTDGDKNNSAIYYILRYRLRAHPAGIALCEEIKKMGVNTILAWAPNGGLRFRNKVCVEELSVSALYAELQRAIRCLIESQLPGSQVKAINFFAQTLEKRIDQPDSQLSI